MKNLILIRQMVKHEIWYLYSLISSESYFLFFYTSITSRSMKPKKKVHSAYKSLKKYRLPLKVIFCFISNSFSVDNNMISLNKQRTHIFCKFKINYSNQANSGTFVRLWFFFHFINCYFWKLFTDVSRFVIIEDFFSTNYKMLRILNSLFVVFTNFF